MGIRNVDRCGIITPSSSLIPMSQLAQPSPACPFCGTLTVRILRSFELDAAVAAEQASVKAEHPWGGKVAAYQCGNAHVFFVSTEAADRLDSLADGARGMGKAAGVS